MCLVRDISHVKWLVPDALRYFFLGNEEVYLRIITFDNAK